MPISPTRSGKRDRSKSVSHFTAHDGKRNPIPDLKSLTLITNIEAKSVRAHFKWRDAEVTFMVTHFSETWPPKNWPPEVALSKLIMSAACAFCQQFLAEEIEKEGGKKRLKDKMIVKTVFAKWKREKSAWEEKFNETVKLCEISAIMDG